MKKSLVLVLAFLCITLACFAQGNDSINFISPVKSTVWKAGSIDTVKIYFKKSAGNYNIYVGYKKAGNDYLAYFSSIFQSGNTSILWNTYSTLEPGSYNVVLYDNNTSQYYYSDTFKIIPADPSLQIVYPYNKTQIQTGKDMTIHYASVYKDSINIQLSLDNGLSWDTLVRNQVVDAQYFSMSIIAIPNTSSKSGILKISNYRNTLSDSIIINLIDTRVYKFFSPTDTSKWRAGSMINIQFSKSDSIYNYWNINCYKVGASNNSIFNTYGSQTGLVNTQATIDAVTDSGKYYLEISDYYTGQSSFSDTFTIKAAAPYLNLQQINGNYFLSGETAYLYWSSISIYKIFVVFSKDGGNTWDTLARNLPSPNSYNNSAKIKFPLVNSTYSNCKIKIGCPGKVVSSIQGPLTLSNTSPYIIGNPAKNTNVNAGTTYTVKYNSTVTNYCNVYLIGKNGTDYINSFYSTYGLNSFSWMVSQYTDSGKYRIAIYDQTLGRYFYGDMFNIAPAPSSLTITSPLSNFYLVSGKQFNLGWNAINSGLINVLFSKNGGSTWDTIATNINSPNTPYGNNSTSITAPIVSGTYNNCIIKIVGKSGNVFSIVSNIIISDKDPYQFITPNDSTKWVAGNYVQIKFYNHNVLGNYWQLSCQKIGGQNNYINSNSQTGLVTINWNMSSYLDSGYYRLVLYDQSVSQYYYSDTFYISPAAASLSIYSPAANNYLVSGETFTLSWNAINSGLIHAEMSKDGGSSWETLATNIKSPNTEHQSNSIVIKVPVVSKTYNNCMLRIMNNAQTAFNIVTNIVISNVAPYQFIAPNDTTKWTAGSNVNVTFTNALNNYWTLYYQKIGNYTNYIYSNYQTGLVGYTWNIYSYIDPGYYQMAVYDQTLNRYFYSDTFYIAPAPPSLYLQSPVSGTYYASSSIYVYWSALNSGPINIEISTDAGISWDTIAKNVYSNNNTYNSYQVTLPVFQNSTSNGILKISNQSNTLSSQVSNLTFTNKLPHSFISPTKRDTISRSSYVQIKIYNNKIDYNYIYMNYKNVRTNSQYGLYSIYTSDSTDYLYWNIPEDIDTGKYQIFFYDGTLGRYVYSDTFTITPRIETIYIDFPRPGTTIYSGSNFQISFVYSGGVNVEISEDNGTTWIPLASNVYDSTYFLAKAPIFEGINNGGILRLSNLSNTVHGTVNNLVFSNNIPFKFMYPNNQTIVNSGSIMNIKAIASPDTYWFLFYKKLNGNIVLLDSALTTSDDTIRENWNIDYYLDAGKYQLCSSDGNQFFYSDTFQIKSAAASYKLNEIRSFNVYPNPFENNLAVAFESPGNSKVEIDMYDLLGKKIKSIYSGIFPYGKHSQFIDCSGFQSGVYIIQMKTINGITKQIVVKK
jgi:hypothetical protein